MNAHGGVLSLDLLEKVDPRSVRQHQIAEHHVGLVLLYRRARIGKRGSRLDVPSLFLENDGKEITQRRLVIDDQQVHGGDYRLSASMMASRSSSR